MKSYKNYLLLLMLSIFLTTTLLLFQTSLLLRFKLFKPDYYLTKLNSNKIYIYTEKLFVKNIKSKINSKNIPNEIWNNMLPKDWVSDEYSNIVYGLIDYFKGTKTDMPQINTVPLLKNYESNINNLKNTPNSDYIREIEKLRDALINTAGEFPFSNKNTAYLSGKLLICREFLKFTYKLSGVFLVLSIFLTGLIFYLAPKKRWTGFSFITAGTVTILPPILTLVLFKPTNITMLLDFKNILSTKPISDIANFKIFATSVVSELLSYMAIYGELMILAGIILISVSSHLETKKTHYYFNHLFLDIHKTHNKI